MNKTFYTLSVNDIRAVFQGTLKEADLPFNKMISSGILPGPDLLVVSLKYKYKELSKILSGLASLQVPQELIKKGLLITEDTSVGIAAAKLMIEHQFAKMLNSEVRVIGPHENEDSEITRMLAERSDDKGQRKCYIIHSVPPDLSDIEKFAIPSLSFPCTVTILYDKRKFDKAFFSDYPNKGYFEKFVPVKPDISQSNELIEKLQNITKGMNEQLLRSLTTNLDESAITRYETLRNSGSKFVMLVGANSPERMRFVNHMLDQTQDNKAFKAIDVSLIRTQRFKKILLDALELLFIPIPILSFLRGVGGLVQNRNKILETGNDESAFKEELLQSREFMEGTIFIDNIDALPDDYQKIIIAKLTSMKDRSSLHGENDSSPFFIFGTDSAAKLSGLEGRLHAELMKSSIQLTDTHNLSPYKKKKLIFDILKFINNKLPKLSNQPGIPDMSLYIALDKSSIQEIVDTTFLNSIEIISSLMSGLITDAVSSLISGDEILGANGGIIIRESEVSKKIEFFKSLEDDVPIQGQKSSEGLSNLYRVDLDSVKDLRGFLTQIEKDYLVEAFKKYGLNQARVAQELGMSQAMVSRKLGSHGISYKQVGESE